jgi:D-tyrosyl-tRNA(Tyr) deacylase
MVDGKVAGSIGLGWVALVGVQEDDGPEDAAYIAQKTAQLRCFNDEAGKFNLSLLDIGGAVLVVSQFTLLGDCRKGRRPSFSQAAAPSEAERLYEHTAAILREQGVEVATGRFATHMQVDLVNDGPVTLLLDSKKSF